MFFRNLTIRIAKSISKLLSYKFWESEDLYLAKTDDILIVTDDILVATDDILVATDDILVTTDDILVATDDILIAFDFVCARYESIDHKNWYTVRVGLDFMIPIVIFGK